VRALSLEYHDVVPHDAFDSSGFPGPGPASYKLTQETFKQHLDAIEARIRRPVLRAPDWLVQLQKEQPIFITFDDGGLSAYTFIADALERRSWRGHFFVTVGRIGTPTFLSATQLHELHQRGHVIGTHSFSHPARMGGCSREQLADEWHRSVGILGDILGDAVLTGSVPGGFYTRTVAEIASQAGLRVLFTSAPTIRCHTVDSCLVLGRYTLRRWSKSETAGALAAGAMLPRAGQWALYGGLDLLRRIAGDHYTKIRRRFWQHRG
jgi:peptidoglycan/xylan/chitin deacetylase (PgdA/CDA1 family)